MLVCALHRASEVGHPLCVLCVLCVLSSQGLVGTAQGSVHYISWGESACVKLVSGHSDMVSELSEGRGELRPSEVNLT